MVRRGDIYYADLSPVVGSEQGGIRPVLVIQNNIGNRHSPTIICAAITSKMNKAKLPTHIEISTRDYNIVKKFCDPVRADPYNRQAATERICMSYRFCNDEKSRRGDLCQPESAYIRQERGLTDEKKRGKLIKIMLWLRRAGGSTSLN